MRLVALVFLILAACMLTSMNVYAYVGPGLGMGAIGALLAGAMAILLAAAGLIWYPIKRLIRKIRAMASKSGESSRIYSDEEKPGQKSTQ